MHPAIPLALPRPEVHGHRGCRGLFPENTLPAFLHAVALGVDVLELDVVVSQDEQVVVAHDFWLAARLGYGPGDTLLDSATERQYRLYAMSYANIRQCALGVLPHPLFPEQQLVRTYRPLLREMLQATTAACQQLGRSPVRYAIELKSTPSGDGFLHPIPARFVELVLAELAVADAAARTTLLSFDPRILQAARQAAPTQALCFLAEDTLPPLSLLFRNLGFMPHVFGPAYRLVTPLLLHYLRQHYPGTQLVPWTVNSEADLLAALNWQPTGITTDYPDRLLNMLQRR